MTGWLGSQNIQHLSVKFTALYGCVLWCPPPLIVTSELTIVDIIITKILQELPTCGTET